MEPLPWRTHVLFNLAVWAPAAAAATATWAAGARLRPDAPVLVAATGALVGLAAVLAVATVLAAAASYVRLPDWLERPLYLAEKRRHLATRIHPLVDYPFRAFVEFELDTHYDAGGLRATRRAVADWLARFQDRVDRMIDDSGTLDLPAAKGPDRV